MDKERLLEEIRNCRAKLEVADHHIAKGEAFDAENALKVCQHDLAHALLLVGDWCDAEEKVLEKQSEADGYTIAE